ncbi:hypothetical protein TRFO_28639 [Tritrichomonas foetus]|uniref:Uncharacterized protein n=1 Tax=Tritrichomonas foetus TaxID=1144522 RepID=A0A1J4JZ56_9EUKA|nr:hypothetical protein TRFO_28639 [Tritrichomonas foetus]|eukprot:OHT03978.1 hypothetical protein TRFO_28639 [Tritrichomonas foetus]
MMNEADEKERAYSLIFNHFCQLNQHIKIPHHSKMKKEYENYKCDFEQFTNHVPDFHKFPTKKDEMCLKDLFINLKKFLPRTPKIDSQIHFLNNKISIILNDDDHQNDNDSDKNEQLIKTCVPIANVCTTNQKIQTNEIFQEIREKVQKNMELEQMKSFLKKKISEKNKSINDSLILYKQIVKDDVNRKNVNQFTKCYTDLYVIKAVINADINMAKS